MPSGHDSGSKTRPLNESLIVILNAVEYGTLVASLTQLRGFILSSS